MPRCWLIVQMRQLQQKVEDFLPRVENQRHQPRILALAKFVPPKPENSSLLFDVPLARLLCRKGGHLGLWVLQESLLLPPTRCTTFSPTFFGPHCVKGKARQFAELWMPERLGYESGSAWSSFAPKEATDAARFQQVTLTESFRASEIDLNIQYRSVQQNSCMRNNANPLPLIS